MSQTGPLQFVSAMLRPNCEYLRQFWFFHYKNIINNIESCSKGDYIISIIFFRQTQGSVPSGYSFKMLINH